MRVVFFFALLLAAAWGGFALGWMANAWRNHRRNRDADRSLRYQVATQDEEFERMRDALERARSELLHLRARVAGMDDATDDLAQIGDVDEATVRELQRLGYDSDRDVAGWTAEDVERVLAEARALHREEDGRDP